MNKKYKVAKWRQLALVVTVALFLGVFAMAPAAAQEATDILVWSLGYDGDYNDALVERFNEAHDDVQITYEDVLTGTFTENNQKVRIALENEAGPACARRRRCRSEPAGAGLDRASPGLD